MKKFNNDRRNANGMGGGVPGGRMMQDRKRKWEGGNDDDKDTKRPAHANARFSSDGRSGFQAKPATNGYGGGFNQAQKTFGGYNRDANATGGYQQQRPFSKPPATGGYEHKPQMHSSAVPSATMPMTYQQPAYGAYQAMSFAQYPPMSFAFPPPSASAMPPLPKN